MRKPKKVYGPYDKKDGRQVIILQYEDKSRRTVSYPKYLMEVRLDRELDPDKETVDHIDRDFTNNEWWNLRVIERSRHAKEDATRRKPTEFTCAMCETVFEKDASYVYTNRKAGKAGPFCSRKCAGTYGMKVKKGEIEKVVVGGPMTGVAQCTSAAGTRSRAPSRSSRQKIKNSIVLLSEKKTSEL